MDANGKPIQATTVSANFQGSRSNITQKPPTSSHVPTSTFVKDVYRRNGR